MHLKNFVFSLKKDHLTGVQETVSSNAIGIIFSLWQYSMKSMVGVKDNNLYISGLSKARLSS